MTYRSLVANLSAANCYKSDHLKRPENWALGKCRTHIMVSECCLESILINCFSFLKQKFSPIR